MSSSSPQFRKEKYHNWNVFIILDNNAATSLEELLDSSESPFHVFRDDGRSRVTAFKYKDKDYVLRIPHEKNKRKWLRFRSLYMKGESRRLIMNMSVLHSRGLPVPKPLLYMERRRFGMIFESRAVYEMAWGHPVKKKRDSEDLLRAWVKTVMNLHKTGFIHRDPNLNNFLEDNGRIRMIDCSSVRPLRFRLQVMYDLVLVKNSAPDFFKKEMPEYYSKPLFRIALYFNNIEKSLRKIKGFLRNIFGIKRKYV
jgi:tRNA A-37 threonylcarbamoyl transferase component Bud32